MLHNNPNARPSLKSLLTFMKTDMFWMFEQHLKADCEHFNERHEHFRELVGKQLSDSFAFLSDLIFKSLKGVDVSAPALCEVLISIHSKHVVSWAET